MVGYRREECQREECRREECQLGAFQRAAMGARWWSLRASRSRRHRSQLEGFQKAACLMEELLMGARQMVVRRPPGECQMGVLQKEEYQMEACQKEAMGARW